MGEAIADSLGVVAGDGLLVVAVGGGDYLGKVLLREDVVDPGEVGLVSWWVAGGFVWDLRGLAACCVGCDGHWVGQSDDGLHIEVGFDGDALLGLLDCETGILLWSTINADKLVLGSSRYRFWLVLLEEELGVWSDGNLAEEIVETDLVLASGFLDVSLGLVKGSETIRCRALRFVSNCVSSFSHHVPLIVHTFFSAGDLAS